MQIDEELGLIIKTKNRKKTNTEEMKINSKTTNIDDGIRMLSIRVTTRVVQWKRISYCTYGMKEANPQVVPKRVHDGGRRKRWKKNIIRTTNVTRIIPTGWVFQSASVTGARNLDTDKTVA